MLFTGKIHSKATIPKELLWKCFDLLTLNMKERYQHKIIMMRRSEMHIKPTLNDYSY